MVESNGRFLVIRIDLLREWNRVYWNREWKCTRVLKTVKTSKSRGAAVCCAPAAPRVLVYGVNLAGSTLHQIIWLVVLAVHDDTVALISCCVNVLRGLECACACAAWRCSTLQYPIYTSAAGRGSLYTGNVFSLQRSNLHGSFHITCRFVDKLMPPFKHRMMSWKCCDDN